MKHISPCPARARWVALFAMAESPRDSNHAGRRRAHDGPRAPHGLGPV